MSTPELSDIRRDFERVSPATVQKASSFAASILADVAGRRGTLDGRITPVSPSARMAGAAFTIEVRPGDNLMIHAAMTMAKPGDVLVVDGKADRTCALMGSIMINACMKLGIVGVVAKGLLFLLFIGIVVFLGALVLSALRMRRRPGSRAAR